MSDIANKVTTLRTDALSTIVSVDGVELENA
jgi:hypothetical protein